MEEKEGKGRRRLEGRGKRGQMRGAGGEGRGVWGGGIGMGMAREETSERAREGRSLCGRLSRSLKGNEGNGEDALQRKASTM